MNKISTSLIALAVAALATYGLYIFRIYAEITHKLFLSLSKSLGVNPDIVICATIMLYISYLMVKLYCSKDKPEQV